MTAKIDPQQYDSSYDPLHSETQSKLSGNVVNTASTPDMATDRSTSPYQQTQGNVTTYKGRWKFIILFAVLQTAIGFQLGYIFCYTNQITPALNAKFGWPADSHEATINESILGSCSTVTLMISAALSGQMVKKGRRVSLILSAFIGIVGTAITIYENFWAILIGRLIYGFSVGIIAIAMPRLMEETVPNNLTGAYGGLYCLSFATATLLAYALAVFLPKDTDLDALEETHVTQVIFGLPIVFYVLQLVLQFTVFRQDSVKFLLLNGQREEAKIEIQKIYSATDNGVTADAIADQLLASVQKTTAEVSIPELFNRQYRGGTGVALIIMALHELTAINAILLYSNTIISDMPEGSISPREGTYLIGVFNFISSAVSLYSAKAFSRRFLFIGGHLTMGLCHLAIGLFILIDMSTLALVSIFLFLFCFQNTSGAITWLYCSEVAVDSALGFVGTSGYACIFVLTLTIQPMMNSAIGQAGTFFLFGIISLLGTVWCFFYLKETSNGLSDKEKKELYMPADVKQKLAAQQAETYTEGFY